MKSKRRVSQKVLEALSERLVSSLERGTESWPLPQPPLADPDFPPIHPKEKGKIMEMGLGLLQADKGMFDRHLSIVVDLIVPHRMNLSDDPFEIHERWLLKRLNVLTERLSFAIATEWLAQALDRSSPDPDRWWLAVALVNGLCTESHGQSVHQGYHLVESIALAERPGTWHTQPEVSSANMDWNPHGMVPRTTSVVAHEAGTDAAKWLMTQLENSGEVLFDEDKMFEVCHVFGEVEVQKAFVEGFLESFPRRILRNFKEKHKGTPTFRKDSVEGFSGRILEGQNPG